MNQAELSKSTPKGLEEYVLEIKGTTLRVVRMFGYARATEVKETPCATVAKAEEMLAATVAKLEKNGYVREDEPVPAPTKKAAEKPKASSKARDVRAPAWFAKLPAPAAAQRKKLAALAKKAGLEHRWPEIEALARLGIQLMVKATKSAPKGVLSRFGGSPDLPASVAWPEHGRKPLAFVAQILLSDVAALDVEGVLPKKGLLSFFAQLDPNRDSYGEIGQVIHSTERTTRVDPPGGAPKSFESIGLITPKPLLTLPYYHDEGFRKLKLTSDEASTYHDEVFLAAYPDNPLHLLLGYPSYGTAYGMEGRPFLAQLDTDHRIGFAEGDDETSRWYFGKKDDLKNVVCTLQQD